MKPYTLGIYFFEKLSLPLLISFEEETINA